MNHPITHEVFAVGPLKCNCTLIWNKESKNAILIDPGGDPDLIIEKITRNDLRLHKIIHTHAHFDHFLASQIIKDRFQVRIGLHYEDLPLWQNLELQCSMFGMPFIKTDDPDFFLSEGEDISVTGCSGCAIHTPGHTPGSLSFYYEEIGLLIAGDTLFKEGIGRTDLWGGDDKKILSSIHNRILTLPEETCVVTGHGPTTSIGHEKESNPFLR